MSAPEAAAAGAAENASPRVARVVVVDDSPSVRALIRALLERDPAIAVVGEAGDPYEAREAIKASNPDVVTLDVEMPKMNGLDFLEKIMRLRPTPVVMVSSLTARGADAAVAALEKGAFDCIGKPGCGEQDAFGEALAAKVKAAAGARPRPAAPQRVAERRPERAYGSDGRIVAIGASTGGVEALIAVLSQFPQNGPPTLVAQHMPEAFTRSFARRLDRLCPPSVCEAYDGAPIEPGRVYLAPGGEAHLTLAPGSPPRCRLVRNDPVNGHRPSVDVLFRSVAEIAGARALGAILTGMGRDGADGLLAMRRAGATTLGQSEASCLIYGMPKAAFEAGATQRQVSLSMMAAEILRVTCAR